MLNKNEESAWQKASASLDASAKIYGFRVDSVHSETFKFLSGLNRTDYKEDNIDLVEGEKKERMKRDGSSTLEKDVHKLDLDKYDLEFDVDPLFKNMTARFNETGARGLLLKTLQLDNNIDILLETSQTIKNTELKGEISEAIRSIIQDIYHDFNDDFADLELCPNLSYFKQNVIDLEDKDEKLFENIHNLDNSMQDDMMVLDDECDHISIKSADINPILDENDTPIKEENIVNEIDIIPDNDIRINLRQIGAGQVISSELLNKFKRSLLNIQKESKDGNKTNKKSKSVKDSTTPLINFNIHNEVKKSDIFKEKRKTNEDKKPSIPKSTMHKKLKILYNYGVEFLSNFFTNPDCVLLHKLKEEFPFENQDEIPQYNIKEDFEFKVDEVSFPVENMAVVDLEYKRKFGGLYKTFDVKYLKSKLWETVDESNEKSFNQIMDNLNKNITKEVSTNISTQTCFVCMLHLANEKNLSLEQVEMNDFKIIK